MAVREGLFALRAPLRAIVALSSAPMVSRNMRCSARTLSRLLTLPQLVLLSGIKKPAKSRFFLNFRQPLLKDNGGEGGIRTLDTGLGYTPLAGERLQPLGHLTVDADGMLPYSG